MAELLGSLLSRAPRHRRHRQTRAGSSHRNRRPAVPPSLHRPCRPPVSSCVRSSLLAGSTQICSLRHERRVSPCLARAHSPAPKNFRPVESSTISVDRLLRRAETDRRALHGRPRWSTKLAVRRMGACAETRHYSRGNDHRIDRVCVLRAFLAGGPGLAEASACQVMSRIRDSVVWRSE